jgi:hypothetical protein
MKTRITKVTVLTELSDGTRTTETTTDLMDSKVIYDYHYDNAGRIMGCTIRITGVGLTETHIEKP